MAAGGGDQRVTEEGFHKRRKKGKYCREKPLRWCRMAGQILG
ncbi:hypothetical protein Q31b_00840 [Novipirellula aureliae]|uniref:Uncharacterized protein n=1 Tax=Novipirellula aureliae TaxID=2527966 RepID=A0A5C6E5D8_9BACT|nr:hypothetical protein Q31b_00840 [Novipirellula aureliae]